MQSFDALVIGGGPAGATAAQLLAGAGWSVALAEGKAFPRRKVCGEYLSATNWPLLRMLGIDEAFADLAGPPVREVAVFAGRQSARAGLSRPKDAAPLWGRALAREHLDVLLLAEALRRGVQIFQPFRCTHVAATPAGFDCRLEPHASNLLAAEPTVSIAARVVIAAHGSWELGPLATQRQPAAAQPGDWLAFKAHFQQSGLAAGLMPLLSFPGGYGGLVHCDGGRTSLSCCIRRDWLDRLPRSAGQPAGAAVLAHILESSPVLRPVLAGARLDGAWLSAGPIQPGVRATFHGGVYLVGNAAGEAHPVVAEGISMAMQSAWLLAQSLLAEKSRLHLPEARARVRGKYRAAWRRSFVPRIRAAAAIAHWARRPALVAATLPLLQGCPSLLTFGARLSGKAKLVVAAHGSGSATMHPQNSTNS